MCLACLVHVLVGWRVHKLEWTVMRRVGCAVDAVLSLDYTLTLSCNAAGDACSHPTQIVIYNCLNNGLLLPFVFGCDMYLLFERYRALSEAEANLGGAVYTSNRLLQIASVLLAGVTCLGVWPWWIVIPCFDSVNTAAYRAAFTLIIRTFMVPSYYAYVSLYVLLTTVKLRAIATALGANAHASGMRRKLWNIGWRAVAHAVCAFLLALSEYLGFPTLLLLSKRMLILVRLDCLSLFFILVRFAASFSLAPNIPVRFFRLLVCFVY